MSAPFRAMAFKNDKGVIIHSFRHGGTNSRLDKVEINYDLDNLNGVLEQLELVTSIGTYPDTFQWGGLLAMMGFCVHSTPPRHRCYSVGW
jgi:hypothetical protein